MNSKWKKDYVNEILDYDDRVSKHVTNKYATVLQEHFENYNDQEYIDNLKTQWTGGVQKFNKLMSEKIEELGYLPNQNPDGEKKYTFVPTYMRKKDRKPKTKVFIQPAMSFGRADKFSKIPDKLKPKVSAHIHGIVKEIGNTGGRNLSVPGIVSNDESQM